MSTAKLKGNASGTGSVTIESPNTNSTRTLTLPDADGTLARTADIPAAGADTSLSNLSATGEQKVAQAWCFYNGSTLSINDSYNVSSVTDVETGKQNVNFSTAMANSSYCAVASCDKSYGGLASPEDKTTSNVTIVTSTNSAYVDATRVNMVVFGD